MEGITQGYPISKPTSKKITNVIELSHETCHENKRKRVEWKLKYYNAKMHNA